MKRILIFIFNLLPFVNNGQTDVKMTDNNLNTLFDKTILTDTNYLTVKTNNFPTSDILPKKQNSVLKYNTDIPLYDNNLKEVLDNENYTQNEKIQFIKEALADTSKDAFEYINSRAIRFWRSSTEATILIERYFKDKEFEKSDDKYIRFKYFEFRTKSLYSDTYSLITDYFKKRDSLVVKYPYEGDLIYRLTELKKEKEAVSYLEILINDFLSKKIQYLTLGDRNSQFYDGFVFDFLCFSDDKLVAQKSTDLLFKLLEENDFATYSLYKLTSYLDEARHIKLLEKRFDFYKKIDLSIINLDKLNDPTQQKYYDLVPEAGAFFSFMYNNSNYLGITRGKDMWKKFVETMPYWVLSGQSFEMNQAYILENSFKDATLSIAEKQNMLFQAKKTERLFRDGDLYGDWKFRFLQLVCKAYPDKKMSKEDFNKLQLEKVMSYSYPLNIDPSYLRTNAFRKELNEENINQIVKDINEFGNTTNFNPIELTKKERFNLSLKSPESCIFGFFRKNKSIVWFDAESSSSPSNYIDFFETEFLPVLKKYGFDNIEISQITRKADNDEYSYKIFIKNKATTYLYEYSEHSTDWYQPQRLVKMLNLCLIENKVSLRFVGIETGDQTAMFFLTNPDKIKQLLDKYSVSCWAIDYNDNFHNADR